MTPESFLNEFGAVANAPGGVQRLREMILQLAVQGKLVEQNKNEESAEALLIRVLIEQDELVKRKIIGKQIKPSNLLSSEITFSIPENWQWVRFGMICHHNSGKTLDKGRNSGSPKEYITTSNLYWGRFELNQVREMLINDEELTKCQVQRGDLLICEGGEAGRAAVWELEKNICFQNHIHRARFYCDINPYFYFRFFQKLGLSGEINKYRKGVGISSMSGKTLSSIPVPLPPLEEQKRIVAKVDQLMALCDQLEAQQQKRLDLVKQTRISALEALANAQRGEELQTAWKRVEENLSMLFEHPDDVEDLKSIVTTLGVQGLIHKNTVDFPNIEQIIKDTEDLKHKYTINKWIRKQKNVSIAFNYSKYPSNWVIKKLDDIAVIIGGITKGRNLAGRDVNEYPYLRVANVQRGFFDLSLIKLITIPKEEFAKYQLHNGDLLITEGGDWDKVGRTAIWRNQIPNCLHQNHIFKVRIVSTQIDERWGEMVLNSDIGRSYFAGASKQTTNLASINMTQLRSFAFPIPPLNEQREIIQKAQSLLSLCDTLQKQLAKSRKVAEQLAQSVVESITGISTEKMVNDLIAEKPGQV